MSQKRKRLRVSQLSGEESATDRGAELLRRFLLGLVTALVVARPLVLGEDPGLLTPFPGIANQLLGILWLLAAVGWAAWRLSARHATWDGVIVELPFAVLVIVIALSASMPRGYRHPQMLIAWEWLILLAAFGLVRRLLRTTAESRALLAAMLACGVSLGAYAIYQYTVEMPRDRATFADPEVLRQEILKQLNVDIPKDDPQLEHWRERIEQHNAFATYAHPNSFAGFLALLLPGAVGLAMVSGRAYGRSVRAGLAWGCALLLVVALWLTHSRGAILGSILVGILALGVASWPRAITSAGGLGNVSGRARLGAVIGAVAVVVIGAIAFSRTELGSDGLARATRSFGLRTGYWSAAWSMIHSSAMHFFMGVGPGNFGRLYPRYMSPTAYEKIQDPHNLFLEVWATSGIIALLSLLALLAVFFWKVRKAADLPGRESQVESPATGTPIPAEFYIGGLAGLLLGSALRVAEQDGWNMVVEGLISTGRVLVWCVAFVVLASIPWSGKTRAYTLAAGVLALLVNLLVSAGIAQPSVALPLWVIAALALWHPPDPAHRSFGEIWVERAFALPVCAGLALAYLLLVFLPVTSCATAMAEARRHYGDTGGVPGWYNSVRPLLAQGGTPQEPSLRGTQVLQYLQVHILDPLQEATQADRGDVRPCLELARWWTERCQFYPDETGQQTALQQARRAQSLDPDNKEGFLAEYRFDLTMANVDKSGGQIYYAEAAKALRGAVERDPTEAYLHYLLAEVLFLTDDRVKGRDEARKSSELDQESSDATRQLTAAQRRQVEKWLSGAQAD
jgi:hypothetical protein